MKWFYILYAAGLLIVPQLLLAESFGLMMVVGFLLIFVGTIINNNADGWASFISAIMMILALIIVLAGLGASIRWP